MIIFPQKHLGRIWALLPQALICAFESLSCPRIKILQAPVLPASTAASEKVGASSLSCDRKSLLVVGTAHSQQPFPFSLETGSDSITCGVRSTCCASPTITSSLWRDTAMHAGCHMMLLEGKEEKDKSVL